MHQWGDVYADDNSWQELKPGDRVKVKTSVAVTGSTYGKLVSISEDGTYTVLLDSNLEMGFDGDMLVKVK